MLKFEQIPVAMRVVGVVWLAFALAILFLIFPGTHYSFVPLVLGLAFTVVGVSLTFGRLMVFVDGQRRQLSIVIGLIVPFRAVSVVSADNYGWVSLRLHRYRGYSVYNVDATSQGGAKRRIAGSKSLAEARRIADEVGRVLHMGVRDETIP